MIKRLWTKLKIADGNRGYTCDGCGAELFTYPQDRLCDACERSLEETGERSCPSCGRKTLADGVCLLCKTKAPNFRGGCAPFVYDGETASLVNAMKSGKRRLAAYFGERLAERLLETQAKRLAETEWLVVPVPLTEERRRRRGYNQAEELIEGMLPTLREAEIQTTVDFDVLRTRKEDSAQKEQRGVANRAENVRGAYYAHKRKLCRGKSVLLVDDVMTSGSTGSECARVLLAAGAREVLFCVVAATPERR